MIRDLRAKCDAGELQFMIVSAPADTGSKRIGAYTVTTTLVTTGTKDVETNVVVGNGRHMHIGCVFNERESPLCLWFQNVHLKNISGCAQGTTR